MQSKKAVTSDQLPTIPFENEDLTSLNLLIEDIAEDISAKAQGSQCHLSFNFDFDHYIEQGEEVKTRSTLLIESLLTHLKIFRAHNRKLQISVERPRENTKYLSFKTPGQRLTAQELYYVPTYSTPKTSLGQAIENLSTLNFCEDVQIIQTCANDDSILYTDILFKLR